MGQWARGVGEGTGSVDKRQMRIVSELGNYQGGADGNERSTEQMGKKGQEGLGWGERQEAGPRMCVKREKVKWLMQGRGQAGDKEGKGRGFHGAEIRREREGN